MFKELNKLKSELASAPQISYINELLCIEKMDRTNLEEAALYALENSLELRENECCREWFERKIEQLKCETCCQNCSSLLGEMRALGTCYHVWKKNFKPSESDEGGDFLAEDGLSWIIEVNTPGESGDAKSIPSVTKSGRITTEEQEICPFGSPPSGKKFREGKYDNVQGEAVSKFAQIKQDEHQFNKDKLNVLYVDLLDSKTQGMDVVSEQCVPFIAAPQGIYVSGAIWWAMYGKKRDPIWSNYASEWCAGKPYLLEFEGKLNKKSKIDFVIFALPFKTVVFQNPYRKIPQKAVLKMTKWNRLSLSESWLDIGFCCFRKKIALKKLEIHRFIKAMEKSK